MVADPIYKYNPQKTVTLIRQTLGTKRIWSVEITTNSWVEKIFNSNQDYKWKIDCDLDTFILSQNEIESEDTSREISKISEKNWKTFLTDKNLKLSSNSNSDNESYLTKQILNEWLDLSFSKLEIYYENSHYPYIDLIPIIAIDLNGNILMQAWGNKQSILAAFDSGLGNYFSRSRNKFWTKGEESGHTQTIHAWTLEEKFPYTIIYHVEQRGAACHTGEYSCFFREMKKWNDSELLPK